MRARRDRKLSPKKQGKNLGEFFDRHLEEYPEV